MDTIVIGGGIVGVSLAWRLAQAGARVTLLEAGALGQGTTQVSFAWLNANDKQPLAYFRLNTAGMAEYHRLRAELSDTSWLHWTGNTEWAVSDAGATALHQRVARLRDWGYPADVLPISELRRIEPDLVAPSGVQSFAHFPAEGYIEPLAMIGTVASAARACGAALREGTAVRRFLRSGDRVTGVETSDGERIGADLVVCCAGAASDEVMRLAGLDLPMAPTVGLVAISAPSAVRLHGLHHDETLHLRPDSGGRIMMRHTDIDHQVAIDTPRSPLPAACDDLLARARRALPGLAGVQVEAVRIGIRPIPADEYSVAGLVPGIDGLALAVTHSGVTIGPLLGRLLARELLTGEPDARLEPFRPGRLIHAPAPA